MKRPRFTGPRRASAILAVIGALFGATVAGPAVPASAADSSTRYLGVFREATPTQIASATSATYGVTPASVMWFNAWATGDAFPVSEAKTLWNEGIMPHLTWEPWNTSLAVNDPAQIHLQDIIDGKWDGYIRARAAEFAAVGAPMLLRWGHEFNGNWYPWGVANNGNDPSLYIRAYRHVHDLVRAAGATKVQWVWAFNNGSTPVASWNDPASAYPGSAYVDWVGIDGYNWGFGPSWDPTGDHWTSFSQTFAGAYQQARSIAPDKPVMVAEFASSEDGGDKAAWINDMAAQLQAGDYPALKLLTYFDQDKEEAWSGTSSASTKAAFTSWVNRPFMAGKGADLARVAAGGTGGSSACHVAPTVSSWPGGMTEHIAITNTGSAAINGWSLTFTLPSGQSITSGWNATYTGSSGQVTATNLNYNGSLAPGASTTIGFQGRQTGDAAAPTAFALNGTACAVG